MLLALETSTEFCSVGLATPKGVWSRTLRMPQGHADHVLDMLQTLLTETDTSLSQLEAVVFGRGPGSFTGVRIAVGVAQGIAYARSVPVIGISTLAALAQTAIDQCAAQQIWVATDARMGEVYSAYFENHDGIAIGKSDEQLLKPAALQAPNLSGGCAVGTGWLAYADAISADAVGWAQQTAFSLAPEASALLKLAQAQGERIPAQLAAPVYLRNQVTHQARVHSP